MREPDLTSVTQDFIFGTLATDELRLDDIRRRARGLHHGGRIVPVDPEPGDEVRVTVTVGGDLSVTGVKVVYTTDGSQPDECSESMSLRCMGPAWDTLTWSYLESWAGTLPPREDGTLVRYRVVADLPDGEPVWADVDPESGEAALFEYAVDQERVPQWLRDAVIYHIFVDRFAPDPGKDWLRPDRLDGIWGGTLAGITAHLDHLADLGVSCLWLSPVFPSPTHHGYDATDYTSVEPRLGTEADLARLIDAAHARGMRLLLDFVANHVSNEHPGFLRALRDTEAPERDWFTFHNDGSYTSFFGVESMPQVAVDHDGAADYLIDAATYWLDRGVDGYRLDYANGPSHAFWSRFRRAVRAVKPDCALIGEIVESAATIASFEGRLDGALDFLMLQQIRAFFAFDLIGAEDFWRFLSRHLAWFPEGFSLPSFLDNHDMNRFLWTAGGDVRRLKIAALIQFALPHPPIVYYGTEVGLSQWHDLEYPDGTRRMEESRTPMLWGGEQDPDLRTFYASLIAWRKSAGDDDGAGHLIRAGEGVLAFGRGRWVVAINRSERPQSVPIDMAGSPDIAVRTSPDVTVRGSAVDLPAMAGVIVST
jgi:cyclomaltodextrinase / maltogenic alpha-amylase / neopullulanase